MPLLLGLALVGIGAVVVARRRAEQPTLAALGVPALGAAVAVVPALAFIFLTQRSIADFLSLLAPLALGGSFVFVSWAARRRGWARVLVVVAAAFLVALATFSVLANLGMARDWQRFHLPPEQMFPADHPA